MNRIFNMMTRTLLLLLLAALLSGCFNRERQPVYADSEEVDPIEVPDGLTPPEPRSTFEVPGYSLPELAAQGNEERPPRVLPSAEAERSRSHIRFGPTGLYLEVRDEADSVWRRLGFTLNRAGMSVREIDESERRYRFSFHHEPMESDRTGWARLAFWRSNEIIDYSGTYLAEIKPENGEITRVALLDEDGRILDMERAEFVLATLRDRLG